MLIGLEFFQNLQGWLSTGEEGGICTIHKLLIIQIHVIFICTTWKERAYGVEQESALSPILAALYIASIFHIFEKRTKNLSIPIPISILYFVDDGLSVSQKKS